MYLKLLLNFSDTLVEYPMSWLTTGKPPYFFFFFDFHPYQICLLPFFSSIFLVFKLYRHHRHYTQEFASLDKIKETKPKAWSKGISKLILCSIVFGASVCEISIILLLCVCKITIEMNIWKNDDLHIYMVKITDRRVRNGEKDWKKIFIYIFYDLFQIKYL